MISNQKCLFHYLFSCFSLHSALEIEPFKLAFQPPYLPVLQKRSCGGGTNEEKEIAVSWPTDSRRGAARIKDQKGKRQDAAALL